ELLTGRVPFRSDNPDIMAVALMQLRETAVPPTQVVPSLPGMADRVVGLFLDKDPERRPTASEAIEKLQDLVDAAAAG
ncbi:MAG TPA: serine/threonine protein kinase, partial [Myxococcota bacterium]